MAGGELRFISRLPPMTGSQGRKIVIALVAIVVIVLAIVAYRSAETLDSGNLLPYTKAKA